MLTGKDTFCAVDLEADNVARLREQLVVRSEVTCELGRLLQGDARDLSAFPDRCVDVVCCDTMLAQLGSDVDIALGEFLRVLKPSGTLMAREYQPPCPELGGRRDRLLQVVLAARALRAEPYLMLPARLVAQIANGVGFADVDYHELAGDVEESSIADWFPLSDPHTPLRAALINFHQETLPQTSSGSRYNDSFVLIARKPATSHL